MAELREYTDIIKGLKYLVCISGAMVYDLEKEEIIYCAPIPVSYTHLITKRQSGRGLPLLKC